MHSATEQVRQTLTTMVVNIILLRPHQLRRFSFFKTGLDSRSGDQICAALSKADTTSITSFLLDQNPEWFDSEDQINKWAAVFKNQPELEELWL